MKLILGIMNNFCNAVTAILMIQCTAESVWMIRGVNLNHPNNYFIKEATPWTNGMYPGGKSNPATIASIRQKKISRKVAAWSFLKVQQKFNRLELKCNTFLEDALTCASLSRLA